MTPDLIILAKMTVSLPPLPHFLNTSLLNGLELKMCDVWLNTPHLPLPLGADKYLRTFLPVFGFASESLG